MSLMGFQVHILRFHPLRNLSAPTSCPAFVLLWWLSQPFWQVGLCLWNSATPEVGEPWCCSQFKEIMPF